MTPAPCGSSWALIWGASLYRMRRPSANFGISWKLHRLGEQLFALIRTYLAEQGLQISRGTIVDATIISAPSSTKNRQKERDPEMHQTKKGNQWYFGMKAHIGVDSRTKLIHSVAATAANVHDSQVLPELLHGQETRVWGDAAYSGQRDVIQQHVPPRPRASSRPKRIAIGR
jgi:IS5 family transposase